MKKKILVVTDEKQSLFFLSLLSQDEYQLSFQTFSDDFNRKRQTGIDVILIDFHASDENKIVDFVRKFEGNTFSLTPSILLIGDLGKITPEFWTTCLQLGVKDILDRELPHPVLEMKIENIIQAEKFRLQDLKLKDQLNRESLGTENVETALNAVSRLINEPVAWNFLYRVISQDGPLHRRSVNLCILKILDLLLSKWEIKCQKKISVYPYETLEPDSVYRKSRFPSPPRGHHPQQLPHHLSHHPPHHPTHHLPHHPPHHPPGHDVNLNIPVGVPSRLLDSIYKDDRDAMTDVIASLFDGPPHEVYMNILSLHIFEQFLTFLEGE